MPFRHSFPEADSSGRPSPGRSSCGDEPTGNLDSRNGQNVLGLLKLTVETWHQTLIMITHNLELAQMADRVVRIEDGRIPG